MLRNGKIIMQKNNFFKGKNVLVTGSCSGIGWQIAKDFLDLGCYVGVHYNSNKKGAEKILKSSKKNYCKIFKSDLSKSNQVKQLWKNYTKWSKGKIDILINNAGFTKAIVFDELSVQDWDKTFNVNVKAAFLLSKLSIKLMSKKRSGRIINISSGGWQYGGGKKTVHYSVSKAAIEALTIATAKICAPYNILVNAVRPGATRTDFHKKMGRKNLKKRAALVPLKRMASTNEISNAVIFLCSEKSSFITNSILDVRGGE
jgi:NAD(P)-dependent dehydrogenase (short-subunit alcohol dehydrogenase family)